MNQQMKEKPGNTQDKLPLIKFARKILFTKMLCSPIFILIYWYFCKTVYKFCMYGGVKKRGSILIACMIFFLLYLNCYFVRIRKLKLVGEPSDGVKWYGFSKKLFYIFDKNNGFYAKKCSDEEKDYLRLKYAELPKYKHFFWKVPAYLLLITVTVMTICGVIKSGTNLNGKLAWYLFELRHTPIVAEQSEEESTEQKATVIVVQEIADETVDEPDAGREGTSKDETDVTEEVVSNQDPDEKLYGTIQLVDKNYEDENGEKNYHYEVYQFIFSDQKYLKVNETLQGVYENKELEYQKYYEQNGPFAYEEPNFSGYIEYPQRKWYLVNLTYVGEDYVSLLYNDLIDFPNAAHPMTYFSPLTIDVQTGKIVDVEDILGCTWSELSQKLYGELCDSRLNKDEYGFYLEGNEVHFIYRTSRFVDEIVVPREGMD